MVGFLPVCANVGRDGSHAVGGGALEVGDWPPTPTGCCSNATLAEVDIGDDPVLTTARGCGPVEASLLALSDAFAFKAMLQREPALR